MRNDQTRAVNCNPATPGNIMGGLMVALGVPLLFIGFGGYTLYQANSYSKAAGMLRD